MADLSYALGGSAGYEDTSAVAGAKCTRRRAAAVVEVADADDDDESDEAVRRMGRVDIVAGDGQREEKEL